MENDDDRAAAVEALRAEYSGDAKRKRGTMGRLTDIYLQSGGTYGFVHNCCQLYLASCACLCVCGTLLFGLVCFAWQIAMIVIGAIHFHECPIEHMIPIYLIVAGAVGIFGNNRCSCSAKSNDQESSKKGGCSIIGAAQWIVRVFIFVWLILGCIWVFQVQDDVTFSPAVNGTSSLSYCNHTLYNFAWYTVVFQIIFVVCVCALLSVLFVLACCVGCTIVSDKSRTPDIDI